MTLPSLQGRAPWLFELLACPRCGGTLAPRDGALVCAACTQPYSAHPHLDLLAPGKRPANEGPGDTAEMVRRRMAWERRLESRPASGEREATARYLEAIAARLRPGATVLDLGCGTGAILRAVGALQSGPLRLLGLDLSRPMLDAAYRILRAEPRAVVARASTRRRLPLRDGASDIVVRRLAPALPEEVWRVLKPGGAYITASFGPTHWSALYDALPALPRPRPPREPARQALLAHGFTGVEEYRWRGAETLTPALALQRLLAGPAAFHVDERRDLALLHALAERQGTPGRLWLETDAAVIVGIKGSPAFPAI